MHYKIKCIIEHYNRGSLGIVYKEAKRTVPILHRYLFLSGNRLTYTAGLGLWTLNS